LISIVLGTQVSWLYELDHFAWQTPFEFVRLTNYSSTADIPRSHYSR
jgi:hypothetical protein